MSVVLTVVRVQFDLMRVFDMDTEAQLLQDTPLCFDHMTLAADVSVVQQQRTHAPDGDSRPIRTVTNSHTM